MRISALLLVLLLATPVSANSTPGDGLCQTRAHAVEEMAAPEKFCLSFAQAMHELPRATADEARAMLSPESLALMVAMTGAWVGTQGIPVVGQAVDATLLTLGVILLTAQSAALTDALWQYANRTANARSHAELDAAARYLARAISTVGINVVAFALTRRALGNKGPSGPLGPAPGGLVTAQGPSMVPVAVGTPRLSAQAPALAMASRAPPPREESGQGHPPKNVDPKAFAEWIQRAQKRPARKTPEAYAYQQRHAGPEEILVRGGGEQVWADGQRVDKARLVEAKFVDAPEKSPFIPDSKCDAKIRRWIHQELVEEFRRYAAVIADPRTPAVALEVVTNDARAASFFESLLRSFGIPGEVLVRP